MPDTLFARLPLYYLRHADAAMFTPAADFAML